MYWFNFFLVMLIVICSFSMILMAHDFIRDHRVWNQKTRDYWYGRNMWTITGIIAGVEGLVRDIPFRYTLVFLFAAALATLKGNLQRGRWGNAEPHTKKNEVEEEDEKNRRGNGDS